MLTAGAGEPLFETVGNFFKVTLFPISEGVSALHTLIKDNSGKRAPFLAQQLGTSVKNIERRLKQLRRG